MTLSCRSRLSDYVITVVENIGSRHYGIRPNPSKELKVRNIGTGTRIGRSKRAFKAYKANNLTPTSSPGFRSLLQKSKITLHVSVLNVARDGPGQLCSFFLPFLDRDIYMHLYVNNHAAKSVGISTGSVQLGTLYVVT